MVYLIWNFQPIQEASLEQVDSFVEQWFEDHQWLINDDNTPVNLNVVKGAVAQGSKMLHAAGETFGRGLKTMGAKFAENLERRQQEREAAKASPNVAQAAAFGVTPALELVNGVFVGFVDVFPYENDARQCQISWSYGWTGYSHLFGENAVVSFADQTAQKNLITDIGSLLKFPYGVSYYCVNFAVDLASPEELPEDPADWTEDQQLDVRITLMENEILTNLAFNLGYIYADGMAIYLLDHATETDYWNLLGIYVGDILIRFLWREKFYRNFDYGLSD